MLGMKTVARWVEQPEVLALLAEAVSTMRKAMQSNVHFGWNSWPAGSD